MNIKDYVTIGTDGNAIIDTDKFSKDLESELDRRANSASATARANAEKELKATLEKEIKKRLEDEASKSAEEKLEAEKVALANARREFYAEKVKQSYVAGGFSDDEVTELLKYVGDDDNANMTFAQKLIDGRKSALDGYKKKLEEEMQRGQGRDVGGQGGVEEENIGAKYAKEFSAGRSSNEYVNLGSSASSNEVKL